MFRNFSFWCTKKPFGHWVAHDLDIFYISIYNIFIKISKKVILLICFTTDTDSDWIDPSVEKRLLEIKSRCKTYKPRDKDVFTRMVYNDKYKFIFCEVPKVCNLN